MCQEARKHLCVLSDVTLASLKTKGQQTDVYLDIISFATAKLFISELELCWDQRLQALREYILDLRKIPQALIQPVGWTSPKLFLVFS
jgi:hypothetical protein